MSATNATETAILALILNATTWNGWAENDSTSPLTAVEVSLHTGDPGETGSQTTNEAAYTSYARVTVARTTAGWTVSGNTADNTAAITFPQATGGSETETHWGLGESDTGAGTLTLYGTIDTPTAGLAVSTGVQPQFAIGALDITLD